MENIRNILNLTSLVLNTLLCFCNSFIIVQEITLIVNSRSIVYMCSVHTHVQTYERRQVTVALFVDADSVVVPRGNLSLGLELWFLGLGSASSNVPWSC